MLDDRALQAYVASSLLNRNRELHCRLLEAGLQAGVKPDTEGWYCVSYHSAGVKSAWVQQNKLRKRFPMLDTRVCKDDEHGAVIKVRRKSV